MSKKQNNIYCVQCGCRPKEVYWKFCNAHICKCCHGTEHNCSEKKHDIPTIMTEAKAQSNELEVETITIAGQLNYYLQEEEDLINYYKEQHDKIKNQT